MKEKKISTDLKSLVAGVAVGSVLIGGGVYASAVSAGDVSYSNSSSGLSANNTQGAINSLYQKSNGLKSKNDSLKYLYYYNMCHTVTIPGSIFERGKQSIDGVFSLDNYYKIYSYARNSSSSQATSAKNGFNNSINACCRSTSYCNATSGTCVNQCVSGYDDYYNSCFII